MDHGAQRRCLLGPLFAALVLSACGGPGPATDPPASPTGDLARLVALVDAVRSQPRTCGEVAYAATHPLTLEPRLMAAAHGHSADMHEHGFMSHTGSDGSTVSQRVEREGYDWAQVGENVAWGYGSPEAVMDGWLRSPGHCANIMRPGYVQIGVGVVGTHWTQVFARPR